MQLRQKQALTMFTNVGSKTGIPPHESTFRHSPIHEKQMQKSKFRHSPIKEKQIQKSHSRWTLRTNNVDNTDE